MLTENSFWAITKHLYNLYRKGSYKFEYSAGHKKEDLVGFLEEWVFNI